MCIMSCCLDSFGSGNMVLRSVDKSCISSDSGMVNSRQPRLFEFCSSENSQFN